MADESVASTLRIGDSAGLHWYLSAALGLQAALMNIATPLDSVPTPIRTIVL